jgi:CRP/FNR family cyclic AMP-dependent transcriptional regulator
MLLIPDAAALQKSLAALPLATYKAGETVLAAGSRTGRLLFLKNGAVAVVRQGIEIAWSAQPGTVFGEISALLNRPHPADVRTLEPSQFYVADAAALLAQDTVALLYVAAVLAERLDAANQAFLNLKKASGFPTL